MLTLLQLDDEAFNQKPWTLQAQGGRTERIPSLSDDAQFDAGPSRGEYLPNRLVR
jgi:hypothetical protein